MTIKLTPAIMMVIALIAIAPNARAEIASKAYVDDTAKEMIFGTTNPSSNDVLFYEQAMNNSIVGGIREVADGLQNLGTVLEVGSNDVNGMLVTDENGEVKTAIGGYITNDKVSSSAAIEMGKIAFPTPPAICETKGCMLMYYDGKYVWETVTRDTSETIATTGAVNASANTNNARLTDVNGVFYDGPSSDSIDPEEACEASGGHWNSTKGICS